MFELLKFFVFTALILSAGPSAFAESRACVPLTKIFAPINALASHDSAIVWSTTGDEFLQAPRSAVTFTNAEGKAVHAKLLSRSETVEGQKAYLAIQEDGSPIILDAGTYPTLTTTPESASFWAKKHEDIKNSTWGNHAPQNDKKYISYFENGEVHYGRITQITKNGNPRLRIRDAVGNFFPLTDDKFQYVISSDASKHFFQKTELPSGEWVNIQKNAETLAQRREKLLKPDQSFDITRGKPIGVSGYGSNGTNSRYVFPAYQLSEGLEDSRLGKAAAKVKNIYGAEMIYSKEVNAATGSKGITHNAANLWDTQNRPIAEKTKTINQPELAETGLANETEVHEDGHIVTRNRLETGVPDPQGIFYSAQSGKGLFTSEEKPFFYLKAAQSDEVRQHTSNLQNALHQRHTGELMEDFGRKKLIPVSEVYGVNRENFLLAMDNATLFAKDIRTLNIRHTALSQHAIEAISKSPLADTLDPNYLKVYRLDNLPDFAYLQIKVDDAYVDVPIVGKAYQQWVASVEINRQYPYENFPGYTAHIKQYALDYLHNELSLLDAQRAPLEKTFEKIAELQKNPNRLISKQEFFENRNLFIQVRTSVNYSPAKIENLKWVIPQK